MFKKKKKETFVRHVEETQPEVFTIPQIPEDVVGLRISKPGFTKTEAVSPMEGSYAKDVVVVPEFDAHQNIDLAYDAFRVEPRMTKEDEIRLYGRTHHEFPSVDSILGSTDYTPKTKKIVKNDEVGINFGVVEDADEMILEPEIKEQVPIGNATIHFGESIKEEIPRVEFNSISVSNEIKEEREEFFAKPITKVPEFIQPKTQYVDESIPKTIIFERPKVEVFEEKEIESIPPFMNRVQPTITEEVIYDTPAVNPVDDRRVYDELRQNSQPKTIYADKYCDYVYPPISLLDPINVSVTAEPEWVTEKIAIINQTLEEFGVDGYVVKHTYGPSVTRYEVKLNSGVNVKKVSSISDNIKMNLSAKTIRIEAPIPGKSNVGIEVPNNQIRTVGFSEIINREEFTNSTKPLHVALGLNIDGEPIYANIAKMPHGLIAGGTGSGKSVCVNGILVSLILRNTPDDLKLILVDPKQVELINYEDLPHLATPVVTDPKLASEVLKWACDEMDRRYKAFSSVRAKDVESYNTRISNDPSIKKLPYLVIVVDELADLMMTCGADVEASIQRITQMGRAAGVHLLIATQRPTTDVVKGTIKSNIPCRIAFRVPQYVDSMTILDSAGAENLLGRGDMLFKTEDLPLRVQGAFINDNEIARVCDFIRDHYPTDYIFTHEDIQNKIKQQYGAQSGNQGEDMELVYNVATFVVERGTCSINSIQPAFCLGFRRAQRIVEILEEMGIVSASKGTTGREILVTQAEVDSKFR